MSAEETEPSQDQKNPQNRASAAAFKAFLMKSSDKTNTNLYDHLTQVLLKIMDERPRDVVDVFEDISRDVKRAQFVDKQSTLMNLREENPAETLAKKQRQLFNFSEEGEQEDELVETVLPLSEVGFYLEQMGVGLAVRSSTGFWGRSGNGERLHHRRGGVPRGRGGGAQHGGGAGETEDEDKEVTETDLLPQSTYKPPPVVPIEAPGTGTNKYAYYVCKEPGFPWTKLPACDSSSDLHRSADQEVLHRETGCSHHELPAFPRNEANYSGLKSLASPEGRRLENLDRPWTWHCDVSLDLDLTVTCL
ncbi:hypothetical protein WMY93_018258 [Mugilogobius chulae]|uniref:Uncharacterized protein n=1 Tax=Mugilogobius chulae TaxID=88201 RepID=A0AAW0NMK5_9GOBI